MDIGDVEWMNTHIVTNRAICVPENRGPLSNNTCIGIPCPARIPLIYVNLQTAPRLLKINNNTVPR